jgi:hypothetical protein
MRRNRGAASLISLPAIGSGLVAMIDGGRPTRTDGDPQPAPARGTTITGRQIRASGRAAAGARHGAPPRPGAGPGFGFGPAPGHPGPYTAFGPSAAAAGPGPCAGGASGAGAGRGRGAGRNGAERVGKVVPSPRGSPRVGRNHHTQLDVVLPAAAAGGGGAGGG